MDINKIKKPVLKVPDSYFDTLSGRINEQCAMQNVQLKSVKSKGGFKISALRRFVAIAACVAVIIVGGTTYFVANQTNADTSAIIGNNDDFDQLADYMMLDNEAIYAALAD